MRVQEHKTAKSAKDGIAMAIKRKVLSILNGCGLKKVENGIRGTRDPICRKQFSAKYHKVNYPLSIVLNENGTWQKLLSGAFGKMPRPLEIVTFISVEELGGTN